MSEVIDREKVEEVFRLVEGQRPGFGNKTADFTAELADENDPEGTVLIKNGNQVVMTMPRQVYEELREYTDETS